MRCNQAIPASVEQWIQSEYLHETVTRQKIDRSILGKAINTDFGRRTGRMGAVAGREAQRSTGGSVTGSDERLTRLMLNLTVVHQKFFPRKSDAILVARGKLASLSSGFNEWPISEYSA